MRHSLSRVSYPGRLRLPGGPGTVTAVREMSSSRMMVAVAPALALTLAAAVAGCRFDAPSFEGTRFRCDPPDERCPDGFRCEAGRCVPADDDGEVDAAGAEVDADPSPDDGPPDAPLDSTPSFGDRSDADFQNVTDDTTIEAAVPDTINGADPSVDIDTSPLKSALLRFDLSALPPTAVVTAAELEVTVLDPIETGSLDGHLVAESWSELTGTWNVRITGLPWLGAGVTGASRGARIASFAPRTIGRATVSLSPAAVQAWIANPADNFGILWISTSPDGRGGQFYTREHPVELERPILRLTLAP